MQVLLLSIAETYARYLMIGLSLWLQAHHVATTDQTDQLTVYVAKHIGIWGPAVGALAWGAARNVWNRRAQLTALWMPHGSTEQDLRDQLKTGVTPTVLTPSDTVPGVPAKGHLS